MLRSRWNLICYPALYANTLKLEAKLTEKFFLFAQNNTSTSGFVANIPLCVPSSITFKKYHLDHHRYQGDNTLDVDIPSHLEGYFFYNTFTKVTSAYFLYYLLYEV